MSQIYNVELSFDCVSESTKSPAKAGGKSKAFDLDDYDDPLADLLSDDDDIKPKKSVIRKATPEKPPLTPETEPTAS